MKTNSIKVDLDSNSLSINFYKKLTPDGLKRIVNNKPRSSELELIKKLCTKDDKILDVACGFGRITIPIYQLGYNIEGLDNSSPLLNKAKQEALDQNLSVDFKMGSMMELPYPDNYYNKIFCLWTSFAHILNLHEQIKVFNEIYRVLAVGGMAFIDTVNAEAKTLENTLKKEGFGHNGRLMKSEIMGIEHILYFHDRTTLKELCDKSKFAKYKVCFKNMDKTRRIVVYLYKVCEK